MSKLKELTRVLLNAAIAAHRKQILAAARKVDDAAVKAHKARDAQRQVLQYEQGVLATLAQQAVDAGWAASVAWDVASAELDALPAQRPVV